MEPYTEIVVKERIEGRMREAAQHRMARIAAEETPSDRPVRTTVFRPFTWLRRIALRLSRATAS
ncbi:MAG TPA: hypothetical protein VF897_08160 [Roseiflexaceae bacterium]